MEAPPGIGPGNKGFADLCLTAWLWRHIFLLTPYQSAGKFAKGGLEVRNAECFDLPHLHSLSLIWDGADYGARTRHLDLGKVALYQMS